MTTRKKTKVTKTPEQIEQQKLAKELRQIKQDTEDRAEIWLDIFMDLITKLAKEDDTIEDRHVVAASLLTDKALEEYEIRWGKTR